MNKDNHILILGTGAYGLALATVLAFNNQSTILYGIEEEQIKMINNHQNPYDKQKRKLNKLISATNDLKEALTKVKYILCALPSPAIVPVLLQIKKLLRSAVTFINCSKCLVSYQDKPYLCSDFIRKIITSNYLAGVVSIYGPSFAHEVYDQKEMDLNIASENNEILEQIFFLFNNNFFQLHKTNNIRGADLLAATKNVIALGAGMVAGFYNSESKRAAYITKMWAELKAFSDQIGIDSQIYFEVCGIGDLLLTATSTTSRNFKYGLQHAQDRNIKKRNDDLPATTVEGFVTAKYLYEYMVINSFASQLVKILYEVLYKGLKHQYL